MDVSLTVRRVVNTAAPPARTMEQRGLMALALVTTSLMGGAMASTPSPPPPLTCGSTTTDSTVGLPNIVGFPGGDAVYRFCTTSRQLVAFDTCASDFDTMIWILRPDCYMNATVDRYGRLEHHLAAQCQIYQCDDHECGGQICNEDVRNPQSVRSYAKTHLDPGCYDIVVGGGNPGQGGVGAEGNVNLVVTCTPPTPAPLPGCPTGSVASPAGASW